MKYIECPKVYKENSKSLFLAGGISNCSDWQSKLVALLKKTSLVLLNPRRKYFPKDNPNIDQEQIAWEFDHLNRASAVSFWFAEETLCPITLYELGKQSTINKPLFVGIHPNYKRKKDVEIQLKHIRPEITIVYSLIDLSNQITEWESKR
jgi:hypothetical protein